MLVGCTTDREFHPAPKIICYGEGYSDGGVVSSCGGATRPAPASRGGRAPGTPSHSVAGRRAPHPRPGATAPPEPLSGVGFLKRWQLFRHQDAENNTHHAKGVFPHHKAIQRKNLHLRAPEPPAGAAPLDPNGCASVCLRPVGMPVGADALRMGCGGRQPRLPVGVLLGRSALRPYGRSVLCALRSVLCALCSPLCALRSWFPGSVVPFR
jgi:hypothetical protein